jgi:hypothetical protein
MQVGCGFRVKAVRGRDYVYFWHYEDRDGRSRQVHDYLGPRRSAATARRLVEAVETYFARASNDLRRQLEAHRAAIAAMRA